MYMAINFHIKTKNIDLTPHISSQVHEKLKIIEKFLDAYEDDAVLAEIEVGLRTNRHRKGEDIYRTEANVSYKGKMYRAVTKAGSIDSALNALKDKIEKVVKRQTTKKTDLGRSSARLFKKIMRRK